MAIYRSAVLKGGRNDTLFRVSILARDSGMSQTEVISVLAHVHAAQPPNDDHRHETYAKRYQEALRTIASTFSRSPRSGQHTWSEPEQLPNNVREALLARKWTFAIRTIEGLRLKGVQPGQTFTRREAVDLLSGVVGKTSVYKTCKLTLPNGQLLVTKISPDNPPGTPNGVASNTGPGTIPKCLVITTKKPRLNRDRGRPEDLLLMPTNLELAGKLGLGHSTISDPLTLDDLSSAKSTRTALHTGYIKRKPGQYPIQWLANRLGMTVRTVQNYNREDPNIHSEVVCLEQPIFWGNLDLIPDVLPHNGMFLTDSQGKKYPAKPAIARVLLAKKQRVTLKRRLPNYYWYGQGAPPLAAMRFQADLHAITEEIRQRQRTWRPFKLAEGGMFTAANRPNAPPRTSTKQCAEPKSESRARKQPRPRRQQDPALAQHVYEAINRMSQDREGRISLENANKLVATHGAGRVREALERTMRRKGVRNPAGFLVTLLRSEAVG